MVLMIKLIVTMSAITSHIRVSDMFAIMDTTLMLIMSAVKVLHALISRLYMFV